MHRGAVGRSSRFALRRPTARSMLETGFWDGQGIGGPRDYAEMVDGICRVRKRGVFSWGRWGCMR